MSDIPPYTLIRFDGGPFDGEVRRIEVDALSVERSLVFTIPPKDATQQGIRATYQYLGPGTDVTTGEALDVYDYVGSVEDYGTSEDFHH